MATAAMLPTLTLSAGHDTASAAPDTLFSAGSQFWNFGAGLTAPLFRGGTQWYQRKAAIDAREQALALDRQAVLTAFQHVADPLRAPRRRVDVHALQPIDWRPQAGLPPPSSAAEPGLSRGRPPRARVPGDAPEGVLECAPTMSIDAIALLRVSAARARRSAPDPARVRPLGPAACGVSLFEKHFGLEVRRARAAVLLHHALGNALGLHRDLRGVLLFPDADVPELPASYDRLVELLAPAGFWIDPAELARSDDELQRIDEEEDHAGGFIERLGGLVERDGGVRGAPIVSADLHNTRPSPEDVSRLCRITTLRALDLRHVVTLTRSGLVELGKLHGLERLMLDDLKITDADLEILAALPRLSSLSVSKSSAEGVPKKTRREARSAAALDPPGWTSDSPASMETSTLADGLA